MAKIVIGKVAPIFKGAWSSTVTYTRLDIVKYMGSSYVCIVNNTSGSLPTDESKWLLVAEKGDMGAVDLTVGNKTFNNF